MEKRKEKKKTILLLAYIADVSCLTNRSFYMWTLSLMFAEVKSEEEKTEESRKDLQRKIFKRHENLILGIV